MRTLMRGVALSCALTLAAFGLSACQRSSEPSSEVTGPPSNEDREAQIASEQLAALGGEANAQQRALYEGEFQASGGIDALTSAEGGEGEGAWELRLLNDYAQFSRPGLGEDGAIPSAREYHERGMRVVAGPLTITIMEQACTASGVQLPYVAHVLFEGVAYQGCARRGVEESGRGSWASVLPDLIPAIDACLARISARPARVTFATAIDEGQVSVRLRDADGARRECIVGSGGGEIAVFEPISDIDRRAGEGDPEFQRGGAEPRARECRTVEAASGRGGEQIGWLVRRSC